MEQSILKSTKKILGIDPSYEAFDLDIITGINSVFATLQQLGIGPPQGFMIEDENALWEEFLGTDLNLNPVKNYVYLRVKMLFDPPATSYHINAIQEQIKELEWRLNAYREFVLDLPLPDPDSDGIEDGEVDGVSLDSIYQNAKV